MAGNPDADPTQRRVAPDLYTQLDDLQNSSITMLDRVKEYLAIIRAALHGPDRAKEQSITPLSAAEAAGSSK